MDSTRTWVIVDEFENEFEPRIYRDLGQFRTELAELSVRLTDDGSCHGLTHGFRVRSFVDEASAHRWVDSESPNAAPTASTSNHASIPTPAPSPPTPSPVLTQTSPLFDQPTDHVPETEGIVLSKDQRAVLEKVKSGRSVFFTGPAGAGKSVLLREIIKLYTPLPSDKLAITASTGIAAVNIGGGTLHSFAGIGLGKQDAKKLCDRVARSFLAKQRWREVQTLIIDEISMIDGILFDKLEYIARKIREDERPFGGIQLVISGDFFQLPPVPEETQTAKLPATFAFDANSWNHCIDAPFVLKQVFRQRDNDFVNMLNALRLGNLTADTIRKFKQLSRPVAYKDGLEPSQLFPTKAQVEYCNRTRLAAIDGESRTYRAVDKRGYDPRCAPVSQKDAERLLERLVAREQIDVKVGAQVMLIRNIKPGRLVNGSIGRVTEFLTVKEALDRHIAIAEPPNANPPVLPEHALPQLAPAAYPGLQAMNDNVFTKHDPWPLVHFENGEILLCAPLAFTCDGFVGNIEAHRHQVPLILAWALSIHKSQGQTLSRVKVDLGQIFEKGQAYVALSRATSLEGLELINFEPSRVEAHPRVIAWQKTWSQEEVGLSQHMLIQRKPRDEPMYDDWDEMDSEEAIQSYWSAHR